MGRGLYATHKMTDLADQVLLGVYQDGGKHSSTGQLPEHEMFVTIAPETAQETLPANMPSNGEGMRSTVFRAP